jgi:hypothetical protein
MYMYFWLFYIFFWKASDIMVITNGSGDYDSYLIPLGRLTNTSVVMDLGPQGPVAIPWTVHGLSRFVAQSSYVSNHPKILSLPVKTVLLPPSVNFLTFSRPGVRCGGRGREGGGRAHSSKRRGVLLVSF